MGSAPTPKCVVLFYHSIPPKHRARFADQMDALLRHAVPIAADGTVPSNNGARYAVVTFDDGFESVLENAVPILRSRGICATVFVVAAYLGRPAGWRRFDEVVDGDEKVMSLEQLSMLPQDLISIGSHTGTHPVLTSLDEDSAKEEILESRLRLQKMLHKEIKLFSFPYGAFNNDLVACCREAGYSRVFTILPTHGLSHPEEYVTGRVSVEPTDWNAEFYLKLMGAYRWQPLAFAVKRRIVANLGVLERLARASRAC